MKFPRVFITGMGAVSALGLGIGPLWDAVRTGKSGVRDIEMPRTANQLIRKAAHLLSFDAVSLLAPDVIKQTDRFAQMARIAAGELLGNAGWPTGEPVGSGTAVLIGSGLGGATTTDREYYKFYSTRERQDPLAVPKVMSNAAASHVSMAYGARGPSLAVSSACSSANQAIGLGLMLLRMGATERAIAAPAIGYVNAHGTGTVLNDRSETESMKRVFGTYLEGLAVSLTKPVHGHALGAAGALELAVTVCALRHGIAPPTINWTGAHADCLPDPVAKLAQTRPIAAAISNSFAFGGINASLILRKVA